MIDSNSFSLHSWHQCCFCPWMDPRTRTDRTLCFLQQPTEIYKFVYIVMNKESPKKNIFNQKFYREELGRSFQHSHAPQVDPYNGTYQKMFIAKPSNEVGKNWDKFVQILNKKYFAKDRWDISNMFELHRSSSRSKSL